MTQTLNSEAEFFLQQALRQSATGQYQEVVACYEKALEIQPDLYEVWNNLGNTLFSLNRNEEAIASFDKVIELTLDYQEAWNNRGVALMHLRRFDEAFASYDKALS